jgi:thiamine-phosphate pyrophosphorylase
MSHEISPGVERAATGASAWAERLGSPKVRLSDWLLALLDEEEGRPFELLVRLGVDVPRLQQNLKERTTGGAAPAATDLHVAARRHSVRLRGDPALTTDLVMFAVMAHEDAFRATLERAGVSVAKVEAALRSDLIEGPGEASPASPVEFAAANPTEQTDAARILDVNLNRARESLRVLDDFARFSLNDRLLTEELKKLRHRLAEATDLLPGGLLLKSRDTPGDVGTTVTAGREYERASPRQVAAVNFKRLQESLRSLEEYGKLDDSRFAREVEQVRYAAYTLERAALGTDARDRLAAARVYVLLTGSQCVNTLDWTIAEAAAGGASVFQLREKELPDRELIERARQVRGWTRKANALYIVNDRPDIARLAEADGVHLGQDDLTVADARRIVGPDALVGVSTHDLEQVRRAVLDGADYLGVGPTFPSSTKAFDQLAGLAFVREAFAATSLPAFALGGISPETISQAVSAGATRVAVSACVATVDEPRPVVERLVAAFESSEPPTAP